MEGKLKSSMMDRINDRVVIGTQSDIYDETFFAKIVNGF